MNSNLFAFRVARPIEDAGDTPFEFTHDPKTQTSVWNGNGTAAAQLYCSANGNYRHCDGYGSYCNAYDRVTPGAGLMCDG